MDTTAFQVAKGISQNLGQGYEKFQGQQEEKMDLSTMGQILKEATESEDPQALDNAMSQMLSRVKGLENRKLGADIIQKTVEGIKKSAEKNKERDALIKEGFPPHYADLPADVRKEKIKNDSLNQFFNRGNNQSLQQPLQAQQPIQGQQQNIDQPPIQPEVSADDKWDQMNRDEKAMFANHFPVIAKTFQEDEKLKQRRFESDRSYQSQRAIPYVKKLDEQRESLQEKDQALNLMTNALEEEDLGFFSKDNFANFLGQYGEGLRTAKGAQLITAQKEFLLGNIARAGARPNMYIEKQISNMLPKIGRSKEANLGVVETFKAQQDLQKKKIELADELIDKYENDLGYIPGNIASQVDKLSKPYSEKIQNKLAYSLRNIQENEMGEKSLKSILSKKVTRGTPLTLQTARLLMEKEGSKESAFKKAKALGYKIPSIEEYKAYTQ